MSYYITFIDTFFVCLFSVNRNKARINKKQGFVVSVFTSAVGNGASTVAAAVATSIVALQTFFPQITLRH